MKKQFRIICLLCAVILLLSSCTVAQGDNGSGIRVTSSLKNRPVLVGNLPCSFPLVKEPAQLNVLITGYDNAEQSDIFVWKTYEKMTGVHVNWTAVGKEKRKEEVSRVLTNGVSLDLILRGKISATALVQYGESGLILDLKKDDLLKKYAPNCWAYLCAHPDALASVMNPDGTIYALPQVNSGAVLRVSRKLFLNKKWLENVNMAVPTTTEELYGVLKAFRDLDANGNGNTADEIPFCSQDWASIQDVLFGAFGLANRGMHNQVVDCDEVTGKTRLIAGSDSYREFLLYCRRLYSEGLLDKATFSMTEEQWTYQAKNDLIGAFASTNLAALPADMTQNWVAVDEALEGPDGDKLWTAIRANFHSTGAAVIPRTCKDPALVLRWLDYFWTDEGTLFYHLGVEGETFRVKKDGSYDYSDSVYEKMTGSNLSFDDAVSAISPYPGGNNPTVEIAPYFCGGEMAPEPARAAEALFRYGPKEYWPGFTFTSKENETLGGIEADITKYSANMRTEFITGIRSLSDWDAYRAQLEKLGESELLGIYQAAVERYHAIAAQ